MASSKPPPLRSIQQPGMRPPQRPLSITSPGFSTMTGDRPSLAKSVSDSNLKDDPGDQDQAADSGSDLNREVAALSNKLISAINHQTKLDDSLSATKHELELSKARIRQLEAVAKEHADMMAKGLLVEKKAVETETQRLLARLKEESLQRGQAEKDKRHIEQELENLTTALFNEANKMVSAARKERDTVDRKNEQLRAQLKDTEMLLASHQDQLAELKIVMQQMTKEREESESGMSTVSPSTSTFGNRHSKESIGRVFDALHLIPNSSNLEDFIPCPPTTLINLVHPVLRHDISSYQDFCEVLHTLKPDSRPVSRLSGGSLSSINVMGMGISMPANNQNASIGSSLFGMKRRVDSGSTTHSPSGSTGSIVETQAHLQALKETKFFKRVTMEDIEPTLRLDCAPGLSWLARRNVLSAIIEGSLVIDPMPTSPRVTIFACSLCGENKADEQHARTHRMRVSDNPNAQRYPLCWYCTNRLRSVCDFMAFLRTLKEGLWKCESEGDQKHAWEESVKLRERMFWARIGGGVVPAFIHRESRRSSMVHGQTETPPRTPVMASMLDGDAKLVIPKRNSRINPFLTPEKQTSHGISSVSPPPPPSPSPSPPLDLSSLDSSDDDIRVSEEMSRTSLETHEEALKNLTSEQTPEKMDDTVQPQLPEATEDTEDTAPVDSMPAPDKVPLPVSRPVSGAQPELPTKLALTTPHPTQEDLDENTLPSPTVPGGW